MERRCNVNTAVATATPSAYADYHVCANNYTIRTETHQNRKHLVVPVIMMKEGVHSGSAGPLFHSIGELGKFPETWNGIPVVIQHPAEDGQYVSANAPDRIDSLTVGRVYHTHVDDNRLKAECWLDAEKLASVSPVTLEMIRNMRPLDVSVGVFTDDEPSEGNWNGEAYTAVARNHRPDHLALLPGGVGACSWEDGCGIRVNRKGGEVVDVKTLLDLKQKIQDGDLSSVTIHADISYETVTRQIGGQLDAMDDGTKIHFLQEVFPDYFVYEIHARNAEGLIPTPDGARLFKRPYTVDDNGVVAFSGEPEQVIKKVEYVVMEDVTKMERTKGGVQMNEKNEVCSAKLDKLILSNHSAFQEADREFLAGLEEAAIDKMIAPIEVLEAAEAEANKTKEEKPAMNANEETSMNKEQVIQVLREEMKTPEQFLALAPKEIQDQLKSGLALHKEQRAGLIEDIVNHNGAFAKEELEEKPTEELMKLHKFLPEKRDYSVLGANRGESEVKANKAKIMPPTGITFGKEDK